VRIRGTRQPGDCAEPIDAAVLMDYWLGALPSADEEAVEAHLIGCDSCGDRLRGTIALGDALRSLARSGSLLVVTSDQFLKHAARAGQRIREYSAHHGGAVQCTVSADDDFLVARLAADLTAAARVDLSWCDEKGVEFVRMPDIPVRGDAGRVICQQSITLAKASPSNTLIARLVAVDEQGGQRLLGEYAFHHTRTIPGPGRWEWP
jgi:anti-sigma factor RsiW